MAGLNTAALQLGAAAIVDTGGIKYLQVHSDTPNSSGSNECTSDRVSVTPSAEDGVITIGSTDFTGIAASGAVKAVGYWSAATDGTFYGYNTLSGDQTANAAGEYTVDSVTITPTAS